MKFRDYTKYEVFEDGRIWSYKKNRFLKPGIDKGGYQQVNLYDDEGKIKHYYIHRIVYETFTGKPIPSDMQVNHINEDKTDNRFFENLELITPKENCNWGTRNERRAKAQSKQVGAFQNGKLVLSFNSSQEAQ